MSKINYKEFLKKAFDEFQNGNENLLNLCARALEEADTSKQLLRKKGYGVTGTPLLQTVQEVPESNYE